MSVHDETWDRCKHCKQVVKTWHGSYHDEGLCRTMSIDEYFMKDIRVISIQKTANPPQHNDFLRVV